VYRGGVGGVFAPDADGNLTTDGERIFISVSPERGTDRRVASMNACFAHELEHARQFDSGELAFTKDPETGRWYPDRASYDIGDEIKAWAAQLRAAPPTDFWLTREGPRRPSRLRAFASARTDEQRARVLIEYAYRNVFPVPGRNVVFSSKSRYSAGQLVRPDQGRNFFGRVHGTTP
jgi:hypothetical protein